MIRCNRISDRYRWMVFAVVALSGAIGCGVVPPIDEDAGSSADAAESSDAEPDSSVPPPPDAAPPPPDAVPPPPDAAPPPSEPTVVVQTAGGGNALSPRFRVHLRVGSPQPAGTTESRLYRARLGPQPTP